MALELERKKATFDVTAMRNLLHSGNYEKRLQWEQLFSKNPLFDKTRDPYMSRPEYVSTCVKRSFEAYKIVKANKDLLAAHSPLHGEGGFYIGGMNTPSGLTDHFALFINTLLLQATPAQQREWLMKAVHLQIIGTYAQTELGHGSNVRALETTAHYDNDTDEFIIDSPTVSSAKWWPGGLGLLATHAAVYARLIINGKDHGFNAFVVQIRDENHKPLPGVEVGDIGPKMGYSAYDSGFLRLHKIRVPRFNMLAKFQSVEKGGKYVTAPPELQKIAYMTMLRTRVFIAQATGPSLARVLAIAVRYNAARKQGFVDSKKGGEENAILEYQIQQDRLFPGIAASYAFFFTGKSVAATATAFEDKLKKTKDGKVDASMLPLIHATSAGLKAFTTEMCSNMMEEARKCCGGHGYTLSSGIGMYYLTQLPAITYEGDLVPMALQTARFLLGCLQMIQKGKQLPELVAYIAADEAPVPESVEDFMDADKVVGMMNNSARNAIVAVGMQVAEDMDSGMRQDEAMRKSQVALMQAAFAHTMALVVSEFRAAAKAVTDPKLVAVLERMVALFGITRIQQISVANHKLSPEAVAELEKAKLQLYAAMRPDAVPLVDAWGFTDHVLCSTIGSYDNSDMYDRMLDHARSNPLNTKEYQSAFHSELLTEFLNKEFLKKGRESQSKL